MLFLQSFEPQVTKRLQPLPKEDEKLKKDPLLVGFSESLLGSPYLVYDICLFTNNPIRQLDSCQFYNCGTAFVTILAANVTQGMQWLTAMKQNTKMLKEDWLRQQTDMISKWSVLLPKTQLLSIQQWKGQRKNKLFRRLCNLAIPNTTTQTSSNPSMVIAIRCEPFLSLKTQSKLSYPATFIGVDRLFLFGK